MNQLSKKCNDGGIYCCIQAQMVKSHKDERKEEKRKGGVLKGIFVYFGCFKFLRGERSRSWDAGSNGLRSFRPGLIYTLQSSFYLYSVVTCTLPFSLSFPKLLS